MLRSEDECAQCHTQGLISIDRIPTLPLCHIYPVTVQPTSTWTFNWTPVQVTHHTLQLLAVVGRGGVSDIVLGGWGEWCQWGEGMCAFKLQAFSRTKRPSSLLWAAGGPRVGA